MTCPHVNSSLSVLDNSGIIVPPRGFISRDINDPGGQSTALIAIAGPYVDAESAVLRVRPCLVVLLVMFSSPLAAKIVPKIRTLICQCLFLYGRNTLSVFSRLFVARWFNSQGSLGGTAQSTAWKKSRLSPFFNK